MAFTIGIDARKLNDFGIGTYIRHLIDALAELEEDNNYVLLAAPHDLREFDYLPENFKVVVETSPVYSVRELIALSWRLFRLKLDLYHSTHYVLPAVMPCRVVVTIHDIIHLLYPEYLPNSVAYFYAHRMIKRSLLRGDRIIAVSQNTKADLVKFFGVDGHKINVVYSGVADKYRQGLSEEELGAALSQLGIDRPYALFVGNPKPHKNLNNVVKAFAQAIQTHDFDGKLVCVGGARESETKIHRLAERLGIGNRVQLVGHVTDDVLPAIYQGAHVFLYPTLYEGFGLPVVEAMASGVPVITSNNSALKEVAEGYADLVNPLEVDEIAAAIGHCMSDSEHREALGQLGRRRADDFHWRRTAEATLRVYRAALES